MFDQRRYERFELTGDKVEYALDSFSEDEVFEADVINVSETGLCILSSNLLTVGQEITIRNFMNFSSRTAVVVWVEKYDPMFHSDKSDAALLKIGLQFS